MPDLTADHRIILARIDGGYPEWDLECTHAPDDQRFHFYCTGCSDPDCLERRYHIECVIQQWWIECVIQQWWGEEGIELVTDIDGPVTTPIPARAVPHGEWWRLEAVPAEVPVEVGQTGADRFLAYLADRLKDPEYRAAFTEALLATGYPQETES